MITFQVADGDEVEQGEETVTREEETVRREEQWRKRGESEQEDGRQRQKIKFIFMITLHTPCVERTVL